MAFLEGKVGAFGKLELAEMGLDIEGGSLRHVYYEFICYTDKLY